MILGCIFVVVVSSVCTIFAQTVFVPGSRDCLSKMSLKFEDLHISMSMSRVLSDYPAHCLPEKLNKRTGKAKKSLFEQIDLCLYDPEARMVSFHTSSDRILAWIKALDIFYYDNVGKSESMNVRWIDDPPNWTEANSSSNTIVIELSSSDKELANPLMYKLTFFVSTGTVQVQGNQKDLFVSDHFPVLIKLVNMVNNSGQSIFLKTQKEVETINVDEEQTYVKYLDDCGFDNESSKTCSDEEQTLGKCVDDCASDKEVITPNETQGSCIALNTPDTVHPKQVPGIISVSPIPNVVHSSNQELEQKFDKCISRMEGSFIHAIKELSKTQSEIFERAMSSIREEISSSVIKQLRPVLKDNFKSLKGDIQAEIMTLKDSELDLQSNDKVKLQKQIEEMKNKHGTELLSLRETYHQRMDSTFEKHRNQIESVKERHETETKLIQEKHRNEMDSINEQHESEVSKLRHKLEEYETEIVSLKLHSSRCSDLNDSSPEVQIVGSSGHENRGRNSSSRGHTSISNVKISNNLNNSSENGNRDLNKPLVLIVGTSNISKIREDKLSNEIFVTKRVAYTIPETLDTIKRYQCDQSPKAVVFHSFTNDVKNRSPAECVDLFNGVLEETQSRWPESKIIISLETARADSVTYNTSAKLLNAMIEQKFLGSANIYICDNSNFSSNGEPIRQFLDSDLCHLSVKGTSKLAANMKNTIHSCLGIESKQGFRARKPGIGGFNNNTNFPFSFIPPGYFFNQRGNGRSRRGHRGQRF